MVGSDGFEPSTSPLSEERSNQAELRAHKHTLKYQKKCRTAILSHQ